jgi:hypothetical protein
MWHYDSKRSYLLGRQQKLQFINNGQLTIVNEILLMPVFFLCLCLLPIAFAVPFTLIQSFNCAITSFNALPD